MIRNMRTGMPSLLKRGSKSFKGKIETTQRSIEAVMDLSELIQSSFGPNGMNKIVINHLERISITSDTASILKDLEVNHPVAKMIVMAALMQEKEIGDGSNLVLIFAGELSKNALELIGDGVEITDIVDGIELAADCVPSALDEIASSCAETPPLEGRSKFSRFVHTAISSKVPGYADHFAPLIAQACEAAEQPFGLLVDDVRVCHAPGGGLEDSFLARGLVTEGVLKGAADADIPDARVAAFNGSVDTQTTETKGVVLLESSAQLLAFNADEERRLEAAVDALAALGVTLVLCGGKFGDMALHFMARRGIAGLQISSKFELRRAIKLVGCRAVPLFGEKLSMEDLGHCKLVSQREIGSAKFIFLEQDALDAKLATVVVRGSSEHLRAAAEKAVDDGVNSVKTALADGRLLPGGGAAELALAALIRRRCAAKSSAKADADPGVEAFAKALEVVPRLLAQSCGLDAHDTVSRLIASGEAAGEEDGEGNRPRRPLLGVDVRTGETADTAARGVLDLLRTKENALRLATEAVRTLLLVDNIIMAKPAGGPKFGKKPDWDED